MRHAVAIAALMATAGCSSEPDFDERYAAAKKHVERNATAIDAELEKKASEAGNFSSDAPVIELTEEPAGGT